MKFRKSTIFTSILFVIILTSIGIIFSVRAMQDQKQDTLIALTKNSQPLDYEQHSQPRRNYLSEFFYLPMAHFEPLLLFMLGAGLLLIVTGIKMIHSRKLRLPLDSAGQTTTGTKQPLRLHISKGQRR